MRFLLSTYGPRGTVDPLVALAGKLREAGAEVRICAPPDEEFAELLSGTGVRLIPVGDSVRALMASVQPGAVGLPKRAADLMAAQFGTVAEAAQGCDAIVASGPLPVTAGARSVAEKLGIHFVHACHTPVLLPSPDRRPPGRRGRPLPPDVTDNRVLWELDAQIADDMFGAELNAHRAAIGLAPVVNVRDYAFTDRPWLAADTVLSPPEPTGLDLVRTDAWMRSDERPLSAELEAFLAAGAPPVYVGFGSSPMGTAPDVAEVAVGAIRAHGRRVLLASGWADLVAPDRGADCLVVGEVNHQALFPQVAAVVHHGSAGTTTAAAAAGAPQVVVPQGADQPYWASRVADLGIGAVHDGPIPIVESLSAALAIALEPQMRKRAGEVVPGVRMDGAAKAADLLLAMAS